LSDDQLTAIKGAEGLLVQIDPLLSNLRESVSLSLLANLPEQATAGQVRTMSLQSPSNTEQGTVGVDQTSVIKVRHQ
jgi:hypothetical protein